MRFSGRFIAWLCLVSAMVTALGERSAQAKLRVVTSVPDLAALAKAVGGDQVEVRALSFNTQDPHWVDARPNLVLEVSKADFLIVVGAELEVGWMPILQRNARNTDIQMGSTGFLDCSTQVTLLEVITQPIDRRMGDVHPAGNPHYLYDPNRALSCARAIADRMAVLEPKEAAHFQRGFQAFEKSLRDKLKLWEKMFEAHKGKPLITYHRSFSYLQAWLGLNIIANLEPKPGIPPNPSHVAQVIQLARARQAKVIIQEPYYPSRTGRLVAEKIDGKLVEVPGGTNFQKGQTYIEFIDDLLGRLDAAFRQ